ncbi:MAG TPA: NUDIX domain-containing protein [Gemmatimonadaceae bacterium]|nr:NUDIX domain-containing protein [Gemmatimonadaceae bacterium]
MTISPYLAAIRERVGSLRLLVPSVTAIIYGENGEILLVKQRDGEVWSTPGGAIEPDEDPIDAVVREAWEETGLYVKPVKLLGVFGGPTFVIRYENGDETQYVTSVFECTVISGSLTDSSEEVSAVRFISRSEFDSIPVSPWTRDVLPICYARLNVPVIKPPTWNPPSA